MPIREGSARTNSAPGVKVNHRQFLSLAAIAAITFSGPVAAQVTGPSTTTEPYVLPATAGVSTLAILTAGDSVDGYRLVGIPDGLGAFADSETTFVLVVNHELGKSAGKLRAHGSKGAFVSRWRIERDTKKVVTGRDHLGGANGVMTWDGTYHSGTTAFDRLCSADLARPEAYFDGEAGTAERILLSGEETSSQPDGRLFAHILTGPDQDKSYELPRLGKLSFENAVTSPFPQKKTIVVSSDDAGLDTDVTSADICRPGGPSSCKRPPSELFVYVGTKQEAGNTIERAGLTNGSLYGLRVTVNGAGVVGERKDSVFGSQGTPAITSARFELVDLGDVSGKTGVEIQDDAIAESVTQFMRIEDGAWDPRPGKERDYYFVTTGSLAASAEKWRPSRLWRLRFDDITRPETGGMIEMLLGNRFYEGAATEPDADPGYQMLDNITIDGLGRIVLEEDVGANDRLGRIYVYGIDSGKLVEVARHNPKFFGGTATTNPTFLTNDEESSGVIDASHVLGMGWFLMTVQNHKPTSDPELVQGGQLLGLSIDPAIGQ